MLIILYICCLLKSILSSAFGVLFLLFSYLSAYCAQDSIVISTSSKEVFIEFPGTPYKTNESFFLPTGTKVVDSWQYIDRNEMEFQFASFATDFFKTSDIDKTLNQWIEQTGLKNQAQLVKKKKGKIGDLTIQKVEYKTLNNKLIQAYFFYHKQTLCRASVTIPPFINSEDKENKFLESLKIYSTQTTNTSISNNNTSEKTSISKENDWIKTSSSFFDAQFPSKPAELHYKIISDKYSINILNYVVENKDGISFLISHFTNSATSKIEADNLFMQQISSLKKSKLLYRIELDFFKYPCSELLFKDKHYFYKYRIYKKEDTYFQLLIKSDKNAVSNWENEYFFENFSIH